ncbi:MAG: DUF1761 domain-containing protein [Candidatus Hodarchaeales archaeon]|jgi:hypothetical protein
MAPQVDINYLAVFVSAIVYMVIGMLWYSKAVFGDVWIGLIGFTEEEIEKAKKKGMGATMAVAFSAALVMSYVLAHFIDYTQAKSILEGVQTGFIIWLGFVATILISTVLWENRPVKLFLINVSYYLVALPVMGGMLAVWI